MEIASAAALAALLIPIIRPLISGPFAVAAGIALTAMVGFNGAIINLEKQLDLRRNFLLACESRVAEAREALLRQCPNEACLTTPFPC